MAESRTPPSVTTLRVVEPPPIVYELDGPREGPCECGVRFCGEDVDCPVCAVKDCYEPCEVQGFACGWMGGGCQDGCCEPEQVAIVERIFVESARRTNERWPGTFPSVPRLVTGAS